ncbi:MAG: PDZ domain-containing protein, partial [Myxococcota bacterium]|nr:PDZ domain-containing protein [Myxococcota bacterium]
NTAIFNPGPQASHAGISLAIPANMARRIVDELLQTGRVSRAAIGASTQDRPATNNNPRPGAEVMRVIANSPAETAGLRRGDVIIAVDGEPVASSEELRGMVLTRVVGAKTQIRVERGSAVRELTIRTRDIRDLSAPDLGVPSDATEWGGMVIAPFTPERAARLGVIPPEGEQPFVLILAVAPASPGAAAGLEPGDILMAVGGSPVQTIEDVLRAAQGRRATTARFWREGATAIAALAGLERRNLPQTRDDG